MKFRRALLPAAVLLLSACGGGGEVLDGSHLKMDPDGTPRVVVAVIDSAFNPYHQYFYEGSPIYPTEAPSSITPELLAAFGIGERQILDLTRTGNISKDIAADASKWAGVRAGQAVWFKGTNVIGVGFSEFPVLQPTPEKSPHGVGTVSRVLHANPDAVIVFIEGTGDVRGESLAFTHPAIDIVSTSYGYPGSLPLPGHIEKSHTGVVVNGKLHFGASDNSPALSPPDGTSGPWWSIGVAGFQEHTSDGREPLSGNLIDFIADFTQDMPYCTDCERGTRDVSGTSFATPTSAGVASKVLLEARRRLGHAGGIRTAGSDLPVMAAGGGKSITNWEIRRALEEAAWVPTATDWSAGVSYPIPPAAPWAAIGWGVLTPDPERAVVKEALAQLGFGEPTRSKDIGFCTWQTALFDARVVYWDFVNVGSESFLAPDAPPYIYC